MTSNWLTIEQIAEYLQVSREKIYKLCQQNKMPASKLGGQWRFNREEIDHWLKTERSNKNITLQSKETVSN